MTAPATSVRLRAVAAAIVAATGAALVSRAAADGPAESKGVAVELAAPLPTQLASIGRPRPLGESLQIGDAAFAVRRTGTSTSIATLAGGAPNTVVTPGRAVTMTWRDGAASRKFRLGVCALPDGSLACFAATAWRHTVAGRTILLVDGDMDGRYGEDDADGWAAADAGFLLPMTSAAVLGRSRVTFERTTGDGATARLRAEPVAGTEQQLATLDELNRVRVSNGLLPVDLDDARCRGCTAHARYLAANAWTGFTNPHDEDPQAPGFSEDGRRASQASVIIKDEPVAAIRAFWQSWYHRTPLVSAALSRIGVAADPPGITVIDVSEGREAAAAAESLDARWSDPLLFPADGAVGVPTRFCPAGERPREPVPNSARRGFPLMAVFAAPPGPVDVKLVEERGGRDVPVATLPADPADDPNAVGRVPDGPLAPGTAYRATFTWTRDGRPETRTARFRTE